MNYTILHPKYYPTNRKIYNRIDEVWSIDVADFSDYTISNNKGFTYILVIIDNFSKHFWAIPLKKIYSQTMTQESSIFPITSKKNLSKLKAVEEKNGIILLFKNY